MKHNPFAKSVNGKLYIYKMTKMLTSDGREAWLDKGVYIKVVRVEDLRKVLETALSSEKKALAERTAKDNVYNKRPRFAFHMRKIRRSEIKIELLNELLAELNTSLPSDGSEGVKK